MKEELENYLDSISDVYSDPNHPAISFEVGLLKNFPAILAAREFLDRAKELEAQHKDPKLLKIAQMALIARVSVTFNTFIHYVEHYARSLDSDFKCFPD